MSSEAMNTYIEHTHKLITSHSTRELIQLLYADDTPHGQIEIIDEITYTPHNRVVINCMTQYGKSFAVAKGVCNYILTHSHHKIVIIAPTKEQSKIIMNYVFDNIQKCDFLQSLLPESVSSMSERLDKQATKNRIKFLNGCLLEVKSAEGKGERLMGFGYDLAIIDEACLVSDEVYKSKILRMLTANPDAVLIFLGNPWHRNNFYFRAFINPNFHKIHIDYHQALKEGRVTEEFIEEARAELSPVHFTVLYESQFPTESEFQLISLDNINLALNKRLKSKKGYGLLSTDVASMGNDFTVHTFAKNINNYIFVHKITHQSKKNPEQVSGKINYYYDQHDLKINYVDAVGLGEGVHANLIADNKNSIPVKAGAKPSKIGRPSGISNRFNFSNKKAELYWTLRELFEQKRIFFSSDIDKWELQRLVQELQSIEWEIDRKSLIRIIDHKKESKSPDWSDSLSFLCEDVIRNNMQVGYLSEHSKGDEIEDTAIKQIEELEQLHDVPV